MKNGLVKQESDTSVTKIIEIGGIKMEVDTRHAIKVEMYKVGTNIRVLKKEYDDYKSYGGVIVGFEAFKERPSILIAYIKEGYGENSIQFLTYNSDTKDIEICVAEETYVPFNRTRVLESLNNGIVQAEDALIEARSKKDYFEKHFNKYFKETK